MRFISNRYELPFYIGFVQELYWRNEMRNCLIFLSRSRAKIEFHIKDQRWLSSSRICVWCERMDSVGRMDGYEIEIFVTSAVSRISSFTICSIRLHMHEKIQSGHIFRKNMLVSSTCLRITNRFIIWEWCKRINWIRKFLNAGLKVFIHYVFQLSHSLSYRNLN